MDQMSAGGHPRQPFQQDHSRQEDCPQTEEWTADLPAASHGRVRQLISNFCHVIPKCQCSYQAVKEYCRNPVHHISSSLWMKRERNLVQFCMLCIDKAGEAFLSSACLSHFQIIFSSNVRPVRVTDHLCSLLHNLYIKCLSSFHYLVYVICQPPRL